MKTSSTIGTNGQQRPGVVRSFGDVVSDIVNLAQLQFELFKTDCSESRRNLIFPVALFGTGVLMFAGCLPVLLLALAALLFEFTVLSMSASIGIAAAVGLFLMFVMTLLGFRGIKRELKYFERSATELKRNVDWLKQLKSSIGANPNSASATANQRRER